MDFGHSSSDRNVRCSTRNYVSESTYVYQHFPYRPQSVLIRFFSNSLRQVRSWRSYSCYETRSFGNHLRCHHVSNWIHLLFVSLSIIVCQHSSEEKPEASMWKENVKDAEPFCQDGRGGRWFKLSTVLLLVSLSPSLCYVPLMLAMHESSRSFTFI